MASTISADSGLVSGIAGIKYFSDSSGVLALQTGNNTTALTVDTSGRLLIGTTSATGSNYLQVNSDALINGVTVGLGGGSVSTNTAVGYQSGYSNQTSGGAVFLGYQAGYSSVGISTTINYNTAIGYQAGYALTSGYNNTLIGNGSGNAITTGYKNTIIGVYSGNQGGLDIRTLSNYIVLSDGDGNPHASLNSSYQWTFGFGSSSSGILNLLAQASTNYGPVFIGRTGSYGSITTRWYIGSDSWIKGGTDYDSLTIASGAAASGGVKLTSGATSWVSASDSRLKNVTGTYTTALADIAQIQAVKFTWKDDTNNKPQVGVLAQSVQAVVPEAIDNIRHSKEDETEYLGVRYTELIPLLIASIQELKAEVDALKSKLGV